MPPVQDLVHYQDQVITAAEHFDDFIIDRAIKHPSIWQVLIPRAQYQLFNGIEPKTNIYRGSLPPVSGLNSWKSIGVSRKPADGDAGFDNCAIDTPHRYTHAIETKLYTGYKDSWQSDPFCLDDMKYVDSAQEQLGMILRSGVDFGMAMMENFSREVYVKQAADSGRTVVLTEGMLKFEDDASYRFTYDPFAVTTDSAGDEVSYIEIPIGAELSGLTWDMLDYLIRALSDRASDAALSMEAGRPIFGLMLDVADFEDYIKSDADLRNDMRYAYPIEVISGYDLGLKVYRGVSIIDDRRQARYKFKTIDADSGNIIATRVEAMRAGSALTVGFMPEPNPEYFRAEIGMGVFFMHDVVLNKFVPSLSTLGSETRFGPAPGLTGNWMWINNPDMSDNMKGNKGFFLGEFEIYPKPLPHSKDCTVFIYKRCKQALSVECGYTLAPSTETGSTPVGLASDPVATDFILASRHVTLELASKVALGFGEAVTVTKDDATEVAMVCVDSELAPVYTFAWASEAANAPAVFDEFTAAGVSTVKKV